MATTTQSFRTPGTLWAKLLDQAATNSKKSEGRADSFVYILGARSSGKSTLLNRFLYPGRSDVAKPSEGLEYTFARKPSAYEHDRKDLAHMWELGGSPDLARELAQGEQLFLTFRQVTTAVAVVVVDLSDPHTVLASLQDWLLLITTKLAATYALFERKGLQLPEQLRQRSKAKLFAKHEDREAVAHSGISLVIAATKWDAWRDQDAECKKVMARTLRYIAHMHGAHLVYLGGLHAAPPLGESGGSSVGGSRDAAQSRALLDNFTKMLSHLIFTGLEKKMALKMDPQFDHLGPLMVPAGTDHFKDIGRPRGGGGGAAAAAGPLSEADVAAGLREWRALHEQMFPPRAAEARQKVDIDARYREEDVDLACARKHEQREAARREQEALKKEELLRKKAAAAKRAAATSGQQPQPQQQAAPAQKERRAQSSRKVAA